MQIHWTTINRIIDETPEVKTFFLDCPEGFSWEEGAHTHLALEGFNAGERPNRSLVRHMSISTLPEEKLIGITTRIKEKCSEFKSILRGMDVGSKVALFKVSTNVPLKRSNQNVYLLSSGVGLATFRPLVLDYFANQEQVRSVHSLNIESTKNNLFADIFKTDSEKNFTSEYVNNRADYYQEVEKLAGDQEGLYYVVGSDEFLIQNIDILLNNGVKPTQIVLDKHPVRIPDFLTLEA